MLVPPSLRLVHLSTPPLRRGPPVTIRGPGLFTPTPCPCRAPLPGHHGAASSHPPGILCSAPACPGLRRPPGATPWDPALLTALQSAGAYGGGGDWFMDTGASAHMAAHPDVATTLTAFFAFVFTQFGRPIHALQTDNGKEFDNITIRSLLATHGAVFRLTCPYTSSQNGRAERMLRTLNDCLLYGVPPAYDDLRIFGCRCYPNTAATAEHAPCSLPCVFLGYPANTKGYRCYDPVSHRVLTSRHVYFDELVFPFQQGLLATPPTMPGAGALLRPRADDDHGGPSARPPGPSASSSRGARCPGASGAAVSRASPSAASSSLSRRLPRRRLAARRCGPRAHAHPRTCGRAAAVYPPTSTSAGPAATTGFRPLARSAAGSDRPSGRTTRSAGRPNRILGRPVRSAGRFDRTCNRPSPCTLSLLRGAHLGSRCLARPTLACRHAEREYDRNATGPGSWFPGPLTPTSSPTSGSSSTSSAPTALLSATRRVGLCAAFGNVLASCQHPDF
ncbi:hypothetical protein QYE76_009560 [Lolium multiflorum]|uniref:Integrase catalytic domain-containing protein n=1 Tax=Lolium multiflorum TaxID=4521 RepID=A0AAD8TVG9_LOLMU|nr:hypothetical protein QYE76_009560 [Lolium multiflorum]